MATTEISMVTGCKCSRSRYLHQITTRKLHTRIPTISGQPNDDAILCSPDSFLSPPPHKRKNRDWLRETSNNHQLSLDHAHKNDTDTLNHTICGTFFLFVISLNCNPLCKCVVFRLLTKYITIYGLNYWLGEENRLRSFNMPFVYSFKHRYYTHHKQYGG